MPTERNAYQRLVLLVVEHYIQEGYSNSPLLLRGLRDLANFYVDIAEAEKKDRFLFFEEVLSSAYKAAIETLPSEERAKFLLRLDGSCPPDYDTALRLAPGVFEDVFKLLRCSLVE